MHGGRAGVGGNWIGIHASGPDSIEYPFDIRLRYSERGELLCAGLLIGEGAGERLSRSPSPVPMGGAPVRDYPTMGVHQKPRSNITRRMLVSLPLGAVLQYIQDTGVRDPAVRERLERLALEVAPRVPAEARSAVPGAPRKDAFYIEQAKRFATLYARYRLRPSGERAAVAYRRLAEDSHWGESTVRAHVRRGWQLQPDLKPEGTRTRRTKKRKKP